MQSPISYFADFSAYIARIKCDVDGCTATAKHEIPAGGPHDVPRAMEAARREFSARGWLIGKACPVKRLAVAARDDLHNPTEWKTIDSTMIGDLCPECAERIHGEG